MKGMEVKNLSPEREKAQQRLWRPESRYILPHPYATAFNVSGLNE